MSENSQQNPSGGPTVPLEVTTNVKDSDYWKTLAAELMKRIPLVPVENPPKSNKLADRIAGHNPKIYDGELDPVELEYRIRGMEKIFAAVKVPREENVSIGTFYLPDEADTWWSTVKDKFQGPKLTYAKF